MITTRLRLHELVTDRTLELDPEASRIWAVEWAPDGSAVAVVASHPDGEVRLSLWNRRGQEVMRTPAQAYEKIHWARDSRFIVLTGDDGAALYAADGTSVTSVAAPSGVGGVGEVTFLLDGWSPDGARYATVINGWLLVLSRDRATIANYLPESFPQFHESAFLLSSWLDDDTLELVRRQGPGSEFDAVRVDLGSLSFEAGAPWAPPASRHEPAEVIAAHFPDAQFTQSRFTADRRGSFALSLPEDFSSPDSGTRVLVASGSRLFQLELDHGSLLVAPLLDVVLVGDWND